MRQSIANPIARADLRRWPRDPTIAHLVLLDVGMVPTAAAIDGWIRNAFDSHLDNNAERGADTNTVTRSARGSDATVEITRIRTGALFPASTAAFLDHGFVEVDRLALLERALLDPVAVPRQPDLTLNPLRGRDLAVAAEIDHASFPDGWQHDAASLEEVAAATPHSRRRLVAPSTPWRRRQTSIGFAITGCAGPNGYLQRLAVHPSARRHGAGRILVADALNWLLRRGARRAMVNTGIDNLEALALYRDTGFIQRDEQLLVLELTRPT